MYHDIFNTTDAIFIIGIRVGTGIKIPLVLSSGIASNHQKDDAEKCLRVRVPPHQSSLGAAGSDLVGIEAFLLFLVEPPLGPPVLRHFLIVIFFIFYQLSIH
eukprot:SAG11_NODE_18573_length_487_cov_0.672680_1_plen_102_part_00